MWTSCSYSFALPISIKLSIVTCACTLADTSRHYLPVTAIKGVIDAMTYSKLVGLMTIQYELLD